MQFEWDSDKATANYCKHRIRFENAVRVFSDPHRIEKLDTRRDYDEDRWKTIGFVEPGLLAVIYTIRGDDGQTIRIISARKATTYEKKQYREIQF
jgi:uncharacterized DUF497 family protein